MPKKSTKYRAARLESLLLLRINPDDRAELQRVTESLSLNMSTTARIALREGLKVLSEHGIKPAR